MYNSYLADQEEIFLQQRNCAIFSSFWHLGRSIHFWGGVPYFWRTQIHLRILQGIIPVGRIAIMYGDLYVCHFLTWLIEIDVNRGKVILNYKGKGTDFWIWTALIFHIIARAMVLFPYFFGIHMDVLTISVFTFVVVRLQSLISMIFCVRKQLKMTEGYESLEY